MHKNEKKKKPKKNLISLLSEFFFFSDRFDEEKRKMSDDDSQRAPPDLVEDETSKNDESMFSSVMSSPTVDVSLGVDDDENDEENPFGETTSTPIVSIPPTREKTLTNTTNTVETTTPFGGDDDDDDPFGVKTEKSAPVETLSAAAPIEISAPAKIERVAPSPPPTPTPPVTPPIKDIPAPVPPLPSQISTPLTTSIPVEPVKIVPTAPIAVKRSTERKIEVTVSDPSKVGEGMSSYMVYRLTTKTTVPMFKTSEFSVNRRFSDFLGLHNKVVGKYLHTGYLLPLPPEKDSMSMVKVKISKDEGIPTNFIDRRRALLERYINRLVRNDNILEDPDVREFLELNQDLPKATNTQALSGAAMMSGLNKLSNSVTKLTTKTSEQDQWFEEKYVFVVELQNHFKILYNQMNSVFQQRREAAQTLRHFSTVLNHLAHVEEHAVLSSALVDLANVEEKFDQLNNEKSLREYSTLSELVKEYIGLLAMVQMSFDERIKTHQKWLNAEDMLKKKRETKVKLEQAGPKAVDKLPQAEKEIQDWETRVVTSKDDFEHVSTTIRHEIEVFEETRLDDFKEGIETYLKILLEQQERILEIWENYLPEANKISI